MLNGGTLSRTERAIGTAVFAALVAAVLGATSLPAADKATPAGRTTLEPPALRTPAPATATPSPAAAARPSVPRPTRHLTAGPIAAAVPATGCPPRKRPPSGHGPAPQGPPLVAEAALPAPLAIHGKAVDLAAVRGKGLWVTPWPTTVVDVAGLVAQARRTGVQNLWIRTGGTRQGYYGQRFLPSLVPAAHAAGLAVVAWDFPFLSDPVADSRRAQQALAAGVDAFSPDVETSAEGTYVTPRRLALYLSLVRQYAGSRPVVATVPRPSSQRSRFPYPAFVPYADVFAPMVYWSCQEPGALVTQSLLRLGRMLPVAPIGQAYDMGNEGGRTGTPSRAETLRFLDAARRGGAIGASLWTVEEAGRAQLDALADYTWLARANR